MSEPVEPLARGAYAELRGRPLPDGHVLLFLPSLTDLLARAQEVRDGALSEADVLAVRDEGMVLVSPVGAADGLARTRGYVDIDPERVWIEWQVSPACGS